MMKVINGKTVRWLALLGLMIVLSLILLRYTGLAFKRTSAPTDGTETDALSIPSGFMNRLSISLFLILIILAQLVHLRRHFRPTNSTEIRKITNRAWIAGVMLSFTVIVSLIIYVDPRGLYGTNIYEPRLLLVRGDKLDDYTRLETTPDIVVLGSSRAFTLLPEFIEQELGYSAFNLSVEGGRMEDYEIQTRFILDHDPENPPKVLLIEITPPLIVGAETIAQRTPLSLLPYMDRDLIKLALESRIEGLLDLQQLNEAIYALQYYASPQVGDDLWTFDPDGGGTRPPNANLQAAVQADIGYWNVPLCPRRALSVEGTRRLEAVVNLAEEHHISVVFYVTPRHPDYYDALMAENRAYIRCETILKIYMKSLRERYPFVFFLNYPRPEAMGGVADASGYYDSQHMTPLNNHHLVQTAANIIRRAYRTAMQERVQR